MELRDALLKIDAIADQVSRADTFRGYRSASTTATAAVAFAAATTQAYFLASPAEDVSAYVLLWVGAAALSLAIVATELALHCLRFPGQFARRQTRQAVEQFLPCVAAGGLITWGVVVHAPASAALLPGLWATVFGLGVFSAARQLPRQVVLIGVYYLAAGMACFALAKGGLAFSPWAMAGTFGVGQLFAGGMLYWTLERQHGEE
jgi:hypothetical protein